MKEKEEKKNKRNRVIVYNIEKNARLGVFSQQLKELNWTTYKINA